MAIRGAALRGVDRVGLVLDAMAVVGAIVAVGAYLAVAAARLTYPFALEWIEPNSYGHVARVLEGRPLYGPPDFDFIAEAAHRARSAVAPDERAGQGARVVSWAITLLLLGQFAALRYSPDAAVPTAGDRRAGELLLQRLAGAPGPTFASTAPHLLGALGRPLHFHPSSYGDLLVAARQDEALRERLAPYIAAIDGRLASGAFRSALLPDVRWYDGVFGAEQGYSCEDLPAGLRLRTFSGALSTLATLCVRQAPAP